MTKTEVIEHFGSASNVARALQVTRQSVSSWPDEIPLLRQMQIEKLTGGKLKADNPLGAAA
ncbi:MAG: Cro/Cl family transcriptional regulator [Rickettsiales bacterium]|nr:Cro/Cl family transcriptional regulator [Rickettsiales bacterium]